MADVDKQNDCEQEQEQYNTNDDNISLLIEEICEELVCIIAFYYMEYSWNRKSASIR
jgi:hypothetical protein